MAAQAAAVALCRLAHESGTHRYTFDVFGPGVFYRAFPSADDARAFAAEPRIDNRTLYKTDKQVEAVGEMAVGLVTLHPSSVICVVDIVEESARCTLRRDTEPIVQRVDLVPTDVLVEVLPTPIGDDHPVCKRVEAALAHLFERETHAADRRVYYIDARVDDIDNAESFDAITNETFTDTLSAMRHLASEESGELITTPLTLARVCELQSSHDPTTHVVAWLKLSDDLDVVWLAPRARDGS